MDKHSYTSFDNDDFNYLAWTNSESPETVLIAVHGINGAAKDFSNLSNYLTEKHTNITIYAPETRGQGNDHNFKRRGDIYNKEEWFKDLQTFTRIVKSKHPSSHIIWCGESMGSIIVTHTYAACMKNSSIKPDGIILLAPVVSTLPHLPDWKHRLANTIAYLLPKLRVPLNQFSGKQAVKVTQGAVNHHEQASTNPYFIDKFTLRLLATLGNLISKMNKVAHKLNIPILLVNGGQDYFTPPRYAEEFFASIPHSASNHHSYFEDSFHLLMYDAHREEIFSEISKWITERSSKD